MGNEAHVRNDERAEASAAVAPGGVLIDEESTEWEKKEEVEGPISSDDISALSRENQTNEVQRRDLEELSRTTTPLYSVFSRRQKQFIVVMVAWAGLFSPLSANIYFPALNAIATDLKTTPELVNLTLTSYMIFQGLAPTIFGDLADMAGRRPAYAIGFILYIAACIGIACQNSYAALFVLRCLQSSGSSGTIALGNGVVADIATAAERGTFMGYATSGPMIGPAIGPIIGGVLAQYLGWRSIFWFLTIMAAIYLVPFLITFPETARNVVGNGSIPPQGWNMSLLNYLHSRKEAKSDALTRTTSAASNRQAREELARKRRLRFPNPLNTLHVILEKDVGLLLFYNSIIYTAFYDVATPIPYIFQQIYGFNDLQIGLCFIPFGVGALFAPLVLGKLMDRNFRRHAKKLGIPVDRKRFNDLQNFPLERARLEVAVPLLILGDAVLLCWGWVLQQNPNLAAPLVLLFILSFCLTGVFNIMSVMLVDLYPQSPATATAANNLVRCLMGAGGTAVIIQMLNAMGRGWCFTFIALVVAVLSPILWVLVKKGPQWREQRRLKSEEKKERENEQKRAGM